MMIKLLVALNLALVPCICTTNKLLPQKHQNKLSNCVNQAVNEYFEWGKVAYFFDSSRGNFFPKGFDQVIINTDFKTSLHTPLTNVVFFVNNSDGVHKHFHYLKKNNLWANGQKQKYLVVAVKEASLTEISELFFAHNIHIFAILTGKLQIYQWNGHFCRKNSRLSYLGTCGARFKKEETNIFANCRLKALVLHKYNAFPFVKNIHSDQPGLYVEILRILAQVNNFSMSYLSASKQETTKYIQNGTTNLFENLLNRGKIDIFAAAYSFRSAHFLTEMDTSNIFYNADSFWLIPKKTQKAFEVVFNIIDTKLKIATALLVLASFLLCYFDEQKSSRIFWFFGTLFENTSRISWKWHSSKITVAFFMLFCLIFGVIYKAKLSSILSEPVFDDGVETLEQLANTNLTLFAKRTTIRSLRRVNDSDIIRKKICDRLQEAPPTLLYEDQFKTLIKHKNISVGIDEIMWHIIEKEVKSSLTIIKPPNYLTPRKSVFVLRKGHPLLKTIDLVIERLRENGVLYKMIREIYHPQISTQIGLGTNEEVTPLTLEQLEGAFYIYLMMTAISVLVFLGERLLHQSARAQVICKIKKLKRR
ncbi:hypothetical protein TcasGA2_TC013724 [Tribolium castaneum]|uniref:Ionotropic glutamate receptor C-terminal domain-containing protein n=1 Tax=Tribolium castaneum TaxID=7070 RepID=D6WK17_TRICA|nr:hypothetical protein TcasGA2_TC013724 [Tribolium castaneum]